MQRRITTTKNKPLKAWKDMTFGERVRRRQVFLICMSLAAFLGVVSAFVGSNLLLPELALGMLVMALVCDLLGVGILAHQLAQEKKNSIHQWALAEAEKQEVLLLRGNTPEELHRMLDYHLKAGNIQEAEALSHRLMALVDKDEGAELDKADAAILQIADSQSGKNHKEGLPDWMQAGDDKSKSKQSGSLPNWMQ